MKFLEVEGKYRADTISLTDFARFCQNRTPVKYVIASGYDHFYQNEKEDSSFCRLRSGPDMHQLTFKRKLEDGNNFIREEDNIDLERAMTRDQIDSFLSKFGYKHNTSIFKNCFVYKFDYYTMVFYVCYDEDMDELGRFVEIELDEDRDWASKEEAWTELTILEKLAKPLGLSPQSRVKRSLYEMYRK